ncbi:MAG: sulfatase [Verrucomicrobiales bacterium]|nr:sulfatase [Verrucomicrobiales bacterium]
MRSLIVWALTALTLPVFSNDRPNVLLICIDDLRPELNCYGVDYIHSPNIDRLASGGRVFKHHYVQAPTCGASRYALLTGKYGPSSNEALFQRIDGVSSPTLPEWFRHNGYITVSVGKVSHHPGGLGGPDWNDEAIIEMPGAWVRHPMPVGDWQHPRGSMHGLAHGEIRGNAKDMDLFQSEEGYDDIYPDGLITDTTLKELNELAAANDTEPFFLAVGIIRPHLPFGAPAKYMKHYEGVKLPPIPHPEKPEGETTWHKSGEFMKYNRWGRDPNTDHEFAGEVRRHYAACVTYADAQAGRILDRLEELGLSDKTIVVLWGDHGWHLGEHAIWGKHALFEESLHSPLIIRYPGISDPGSSSDEIVETVDIFPTLTDLAGLEMPAFTNGRSLRPVMEGSGRGRPAISYFKKNTSTIRTEQYRMILHEKHVELYDHSTDAGETLNVAEENPGVVAKLTTLLKSRKP